MVEPITWVPSAALRMPTATAAAEPLLEPPGVRSRSHGLRVPRGNVEANSLVTVLPTMTAPASRSATTLAASRSDRKPANSGEPFSVGMSIVSMMSLMPNGMPSIGDSGRPSRRRCVAASAAARASLRLRVTKAPIFGSHASSAVKQRSRKSRGLSAPEANSRCAPIYGRSIGLSVLCGACMCRLPVSGRAQALLLALVVIMHLEQHAAGFGLERAVMDPGRPAGVGRRLEGLAAPALRIVADDEIAGQEINLLPVVVHERRGGVFAGRKPQQPRPAPHFARLVEIARQDLLLDAGRIAGRTRPAFVHVDLVEFQVRLVHRHAAITSRVQDYAFRVISSASC